MIVQFFAGGVIAVLIIPIQEMSSEVVASYSDTMTRLIPLTALLLVQVSSVHAAEFDQCALIDRVLNRLGAAMAINRMLIAEGKDPIRVEQASQELAEQNRRYRSTKRQGKKLHCDGLSRD